MQRRHELHRQVPGDRVEDGGAHAGPADVELPRRHLGEDLRAAGEAHGLGGDARPGQVAVGHDEQRGERVGRDVADLDHQPGRLRRDGAGGRERKGGEQNERAAAREGVGDG